VQTKVIEQKNIQAQTNNNEKGKSLFANHSNG
jgi:hypothetical protein